MSSEWRGKGLVSWGVDRRGVYGRVFLTKSHVWVMNHQPVVCSDTKLPSRTRYNDLSVHVMESENIISA